MSCISRTEGRPRVGVKLPTVEVRYKNLHVEGDCEVVPGRPVPTLWNSVRSTLSDFAQILGSKSRKSKISIIKDVSGVIKPGRMTLLLGPPSCGKTSLLLALSGNLNHSLKVTGEISYNGHKLEEFVPQKTSAYISEYDLHIPEMTVRETLDFSACFQGVGSLAEIMNEVSRREKQSGIIPDPDLDAYMKAISIEGLKRSLRTDYILKILGLDICAETLVGDAMRRGISGGQKRRLTTGEMIVGPTRALFMDEISNGLDSSTTFQIVAYLRQLVHIVDATILVSLLQPAPETFDLFDDIILMAEGKIVYHGPRDHVLEFFEDCGFKCPARKGIADFLQEVISRKDQAQYWVHTEQPYSYVFIDWFSSKFKAFPLGEKLDEELLEPFVNSQIPKNSLSFSMYSLSKWKLLSTCLSREFLLMRRNAFVYIFKVAQLVILALIQMTVFLRTQMDIDVVHANYYMGALFYALMVHFLDGLPELSLTAARLPIFYKQRDFYFYPAWAYAIPATIQRVPLTLLESLIWTSLTYYVIGYSPEVGRFFRQFILLFVVRLSSLSMFRFLASILRNKDASSMAGSMLLLAAFSFSGFVIPLSSMPVWLRWGFWVSPMTYGEIALSVNEFLAPRWQKMLPANINIGTKTLESHGVNFDGQLFWISIGALLGFIIIFNIGFTLALTFLKSPGRSCAVISSEKLAQIQRTEYSSHGSRINDESRNSPPTILSEPNKDRKFLPFQPLPMTFQDMQYYVDNTLGMKKQGYSQRKLQLLCDITGVLRPGVLTALMGVSGAGKTTLLDVLAGRKTSGTVEGTVKIGGYTKVQETFARISGYCEQADIHSPQITVVESVIYSAWLRLSPEVDSKTKSEFVNDVLETIELDGIKDNIVGIPGVSGLSNEQRKRLTIAVELVANPSIIFMDEPTSGLDARAAAIVMRAVKNVVGTGRTIVCTIHQPSIEIFEAFDENDALLGAMKLILLKNRGRIIYSGPLGQHSSRLIEYFEGIPGVPKIRNNYNPATWMLEVTSASAEAELGVDFAQIYKSSALCEETKMLVKQLSTPPPGSRELHFPTRFSQNGWEQFKSCLWKQHLSYWRSPSYNLTRFILTIVSTLILGILFWKRGEKINNEQDLFNMHGAMFSALFFLGSNFCLTIMPYAERERAVMYRERFAGMYSSWAYSLAQVIIEVPYLFILAVISVIITYPMMGYYWSAQNIFWYFYAMFFALLYFTYLGMLLISLTPTFAIAAILAAAFFRILYLFSGFIIPQPQIPKWWVWFYYLMPASWTLHGLMGSQYGDVDREILVFGETKALAAFVKDYFGYQRDRLPIVGVIIFVYPLLVACLFACCIRWLKFQRR